MSSQKTIIVGLSGGVDSSLTAALLKQQGHNVIGVTMEIYDGDETKVDDAPKKACYAPGGEENIELAKELCEKLNIPYYTFDLKKEFNNIVITYFKEEYLAGKTPNPCVICNHYIKFGALMDHAKQSGIDYDYFATGHYAQIIEKNGEHLLTKGNDPTKDQTYFLSRLPKEKLAQIMFPLGTFTKKEVRKMAQDLGLITANRPESQDFVANGDYSPFFKGETIQTGNIVDTEGTILGQHRGVIHYTIGQRKGLGISSKVPMYVCKIDAETNEVIVTPSEGLYSNGLIATDINYLTSKRLDTPLNVSCKIRLSIHESHATITSPEVGTIHCQFKEPQRSVTPGQIVVFYEGDVVFGSGVIKEAL